MAQQSKKKSQGGGRTSNSEPRVQVFKGFTGVNFEHAPVNPARRDLSEPIEVQDDLIMTNTALQVNVATNNDMTMETEPDLFWKPVEVKKKVLDMYGADEARLIGTIRLVGHVLFADIALYKDDEQIDHMLGKCLFPNGAFEPIVADFEVLDASVVLPTRYAPSTKYTCIYWIGNMLLVMDDLGQIWRSNKIPYNENNLTERAWDVEILYPKVYIPLQRSLVLSDIITTGGITVSASETSTNKYRCGLCYAIGTDFGPSKASTPLEVWFSKPLSLVNPGEITVKVHPNPDLVGEWGITKAYLYYSAGDSQEPIFSAMIDVSPSHVGDYEIEFAPFQEDTTQYSAIVPSAPTENYANGFAARYCEMIDGKLYFWGCGEHTVMHNSGNPVWKSFPDTPYRIYIGGNPYHLLSANPYTGGGYVDVDPGQGKVVNSVVKFKTASGANIVTALCGCENSYQELRYNLVEQKSSIEQSNVLTSWMAEHVAGSVGARCINGALVCEDGLYTVSRYGLAVTTLTMEYNSQIKTEYVSDPVKPVFLDVETEDDKEFLLHNDGKIYYYRGPREHNLLWCYDVNAKAWWSLRLPEPVLGMFHFDDRHFVEGVGFVVENGLYILPATDETTEGRDESLAGQLIARSVVETGMLSSAQPNHGNIYLSQIEFDFSYLEGDVRIELIGIDILGREILVTKHINEEKRCYGYRSYMRVDLRLQAYKIRIIGNLGAKYRMTCFQAKLYTLPNKIGLHFGFDDQQQNMTNGYATVQEYFKEYYDSSSVLVP